MKKFTFLFIAMLTFCWQSNAQFSFPAQGPVTTLDGATPVIVSLNDVANAAGVPLGTYDTFTVTCDWTNLDNAWSNEERLSVVSASGATTPIAPSNGLGSTAAVTGLTFSGSFGLYDVGADGSLELSLTRSFNSDAQLTNIVVTIFEAPPCPNPTGLTIDSFNSASAVISWTAGGTETDWEIAVQADGTGEPVGSGTATSSNPYPALGLSGSTAYEVWLRADCNGDGSEFGPWQGPVDFTTLPSAPPACPASFTTTPDASCGNFDTLISWDSVIADGYRISVGTTSGASDVLPLTDLGNVTSYSISSQMAGATYFYTIVPYNVVGDQLGCTEQTYTTFATGCLCASVPTSVDGDGITNVRLGATDFVSPAAPNNLYIDNTGTPIDLAQGVLANCDITFETGATYDYHVWIDYNDDLTFDVSEIVFTGVSTTTNPETLDADFLVDGAANLGIHKMRIAAADFNQVTPDPCYSGTWGTTLDFDVNIVATACVPATIASSTVIDNCAAGTFTVEVDVTDPGTATFIVGTAPIPIVAGINTFGPFPNDTSQDLTVVDVTDGACNFVIGSFINGLCPPPAPTGVTCSSGSSSILFTEEFDGVGGWTGDVTTSDTGGDWEFAGSAGSTGTGPDAAFSGANYMNYEGSGGNNGTASGVSPAINLTNAVDGAELAFYMHAYGAAIGTLNVGVGTSPTGPFTTEFTWTGQYQTAATDPWLPVGVDLSAYMGSIIYIEFNYTAGNDFTSDLSIDLMTVEACGNFCFDPSALAVSNISDSGADIAWTNGGTETAWEYAIQAQGTGTPAGAGTATATNPVTAGGLAGQTDYEVYVRADCGGGTFSLWAGPVNFTTPCSALVPDYTADMSLNVDACWDQAGSGEVAAGPGDFGASDWNNNRTYGGTASNSLNLWQAVDREWLLSPSFDLSGGSYQLEVEVAVTDFASDTGADTMGSDDEVQLLISTDGGATWVNLTTWNAGNQPATLGTEYIEDLTAYTGTVQFAIWGSDGAVDDTNDYDFHVGKFIVRTPPTCGDISALTVSNVTDSSAQVDWTDAEGETDWDIAVQAQGTGTPASGTDTTANPYTATGLTSATAYEVYVRADCAGDGSNLGAWIGPVNFTTLPGAPVGVTCTSGGSSFIFTEEFEAQGGWTGNFNSGDGSWEVPGDATSGGTGPSSEFSGAAGSYMNYEASGSTTATASAVSPAIDLTTAVDGAELSFYMHAYGADMGTLNVGVGTSIAGPFTTEFTWSGPLQSAETDAWVPIGVDLSAYLGQTIYVEFSHTGTGDFEGDMSIDYMRIEACGNFCVDPSSVIVSNVNGSEAEIAWTANGTETAWEYAIQPQGTGTPAGAGTATATNPVTATGLTALTAYEVYVRADCGGAVFSGWAGPINFTTTEACPDVTALNLDSSSATTANISWTAGGGVLEAGWEIVVQPDGTGAPAGAGTPATNPFSATGLTPETAYEVYVRADCAGDGFSGWAGPFDFTTPCAAIVPDYVADMSVNVPDSCWNEATDGEVAAGPSGFGSANWDQGNTYAYGASNAINIFGTGAIRDWLLSPSFDLSADGYELVVNVAVTNWNDGFTDDTMGADDEVQLLMSTDGGVTWSNLTTWNAGNEPALGGTDYTEDLTGTTGTDVRFAIWASNGTTSGQDYDFHVGRFEVRTPPSCPDVSSVMVSNLGATTADIAWTNGGTETAWEVAIQAPGTGEPVGSGAAATTNPYNATGLTVLTSYEVYVRSDCGGGQLGNWIGPVNFSTTANTVTSFPYDEDFDSGAGDWIADNTNNGSWALGAPANTIINSADSGTDAWVTNLTGNYLAADNSFVNSPPFDMSGLANPVIEMSVWYNAEFSFDGMLLQSSIDGGTSWQNVGAFGDPNNWYNDNSVNGTDAWTGRNSSGNGSGGWLAAKNDLTGLGGQSSVMLRVAFYSDGSVQDEGVAFDTVSIYDPACPDVSAIAVSNITTTAADVAWTAGGTETDWEIVVQAEGTGVPGGAGTATTNNPYSATGLTANTAYEVYVRADCGGAEYSAWVGPIDFTTDCDAFGIPFAETFDSTSTSESCWTVLDVNADADAWDLDYTLDTITGDESAAINTDINGGNNDDWLITPVITLTGNERLVFKYSLQSPGEPNDFEVLLSTTGTAPAAFTNTLLALASYNDVDVDNGESTELTIDLSAYTGNVNIAWHIPSGGLDGWRLYIDDVLVETIPACPNVSAVAVSNVTQTTADIAWTNGGPETDWEVAIQAQGTGIPGGAGTATTSNPYNATGLTALTDYEVYVRSDCGGGDLGNWVGPVNFSTLSPPVVTYPYTEDFESGSGGWSANGGTWELGAPANTIINSAYSGTNAWVTDLDGLYNASENSAVTSPPFDLSSLTDPLIEISIWYESEFSWDGTVLQSSIDGGTTWQNVGSESDGSNWYNDTTINGNPGGQQVGWTGRNGSGSNGWLIAGNSLTGLGGQSNVLLRIAFGSDTSAQDEGFAFDSVVVRENLPGTYTYTDGVWSPGNPSNDLDDIIVASGNLPIDSDFTCNTMTVNPGAAVTVSSGNTLEATNGLVLESSSSSYSSLITDGTIVGPMTYERHVNINGSGSTGSNDLISAPLTGQPFNQVAAANPNILNNGTLFLFGPFEKVTGQYVNWAATETTPLTAGVGYRSGTTDDGTVTFSGTAENGVVTHDIVNAGSNNEEWNLVGNPYPSYLNVWNFLLHDVGGVTNLQLFDAPTAAIYGYDGSALNGWTVYNLATTLPSTVLAPGQGFFVSSDATNVGPYDLEFTPAMRSTGSSDDFIVGRNAELKYVKLSASTNNDVFGTDIYFNANASLGFDLGYDAALWGDTTPDFALYSSLVQDNSGRAMALQAVNSTDLSDVVIPLGVNANQGEQLTFSIAEMNLPANVSVYLEDNVENTVTLLNDSDYVITPTTALSGTGRFFLRTSEDALSTIDNSLDNLEIFTLKTSQELVVNGQLLDRNSTLNLYDIQGRLVLTTKLDDTALQNRIDVSNINSGVYIATVQSNDQEKTKKVIID